ncbi:hypothetical protein V7087_29085, partial [Neobacillus niacini]|uniref:hypothetical protein n=1 Tax=Neobacillus niacini TaxID=86668 RepID=UPI002FFE0FDC
SIVYLKEKLYNYYYNNTSIMNNYKENQFVVQMEIYNSFKCTLLNTSQRSFLETVGSDFLVEVVYGVVNLSNRKCKYNYKEKYQKVLNIINNETAREIIKDGNNSSIFIKIFQILIKNEKKAILFLLVNLNLLRFFTKM